MKRYVLRDQHNQFYAGWDNIIGKPLFGTAQKAKVFFSPVLCKEAQGRLNQLGYSFKRMTVSE
jgi:hypothetical protein